MCSGSYLSYSSRRWEGRRCSGAPWRRIGRGDQGRRVRAGQPRHLAFGSHGDLFVAEAGAGGSDLHFLGGEGPANMGASGAVTEVDRWGRQFRIIDKLPSMANDPGNGNGIGPHGITVIGRDEVFITNGGPTEPRALPAAPGEPPGPDISREELAESTPQADLFGRVLWIRQHRAFKVADIWDFERRVNPDAAVANPAVDSNPVDLLFDGPRIVVADAEATHSTSCGRSGASPTSPSSPALWTRRRPTKPSRPRSSRGRTASTT